MNYTEGVGKHRSPMIMSGYERGSINVLKRCLKTASDGADVTWCERSFHVWATETGTVRLLTVKGPTGQTMGVKDRSRCLDGTSARRVKHDCRYTGAVPLMGRYVRTASLYEMRPGACPFCSRIFFARQNSEELSRFRSRAEHVHANG